MVEQPSYTRAHSAYRADGAVLVGVPQEADGIVLEELDSTLVILRAAGRRVKCVDTVPNFQHPPGLLVSASKRQALLAWANRHNVLIVEDDPYCELYFADGAGVSDRRPIAADDTEGRVIYLSSFSKTLAPGFRVAWIHAAPALIGKLEVAKQAADLCNGSFGQQVVNETCRRGVLSRQLPRLRAHYQSQRDVLARALSETLGDALTWTLPHGGFFLWARLRGPVDGDALLPHAIARGVVYVAGSAFFVSGQERQFIRLSFSSPSPDRIQEGARRLRLALSDALAARSTSGPVPSVHPRQPSR
jgi:2-aminoadipate transaminase